MKEQGIEAKVTILGNEGGVTIEVQDEKSGVNFVEITMSPQQFLAAAMGRLGHCPVEKCTVRRLEAVGKTLEIEQLTFRMPSCDWKERKKAAATEAEKQCPDGWEASTYFGSQGSFFRKGEIEYARTTIRRWVDDEQS